MGHAPKLLFFNHFPPSNINGGTVLIQRLLNGFPPEEMVALTSSLLPSAEPPEWCRCHRMFPAVAETGKWGLGRLKVILNWLLIFIAAIQARRLIRAKSISVVMSVACGQAFVAAALVTTWMRIPWVLIVHDDWVPIVSKGLGAPEFVFRCVFKLAVRRASHVFAVSLGMQEMLKAKYNVDSEIQMPACEPWEPGPSYTRARNGEALRILYSGNGVAAGEPLQILIEMVRQQALKGHGLDRVELHMCTPWSAGECPDIKWHGWLTQRELRLRVRAADILFLPYSFTGEDRLTTLTSFPAKAADYLASGKPILVAGPEDSSIVRYAERFHCAEVVKEPSAEALGQAIYRLASSEAHCRYLASNAQHAFASNHNIERQRERLYAVVHSLASHSKAGRPVLA